jgi:23S rRNA pseudouridine2605 synthase
LVTTHRDPKGRPTVFEHLPGDLPRVISIGRLDLNSEGLLLLTNDGALARALELPASGLVRRYRARARGHATQAKLDTLKQGLTVDGVQYGPIEARLDKAKEGSTAANLWITVTLTEGKNREVRKVLEALGLIVNRLIRLSYGPFQLGTLALGEVEEIGPRVICEQLADYIAPESLPTSSRIKRDASAGIRPVGGDKAETAQRRARPAGAGPKTAVGVAGVLTKAATPKTEYKPGWAKPKKKISHPPSKAARAAAAKSREAHKLEGAIGPGAAKPGTRPATGARRASPKGGSPKPRG